MSDSAKRTGLCVAAFALAVLGSVVDAFLRSDGEGVFGTASWALAVFWGPPLVAACFWWTRAQRWLCLVAAILTGLLALITLPFGYGWFELPTVVLLAYASRRYV